MKLKLSLALLISLLFVSKVVAIDGVMDNELARDTGNTLSWTAIAGESLNDVARAFYPNSKAMQRLFITKTLQLNPEIEPTLKPSMVFEAPTLLTIPTLKSLSKSRQAINTSKQVVNASDIQEPNSSYVVEKTAHNPPTLLRMEYELLVSKNSFFKTELEKLHAKIIVLQAKLDSLKLVLDKALSFSDEQVDTSHAQVESNSLETQDINYTTPAKKSFKKLNENNVSSVSTVAKQVKPLTQQSPESVVLATVKPEKSSSNVLLYGLLAAIGLTMLMAICVYLLKQSRQRAVDRFGESLPIMDDTLTHVSGFWQDTEQEAEVTSVDEQPQVSPKSFMNTQMRDEQAKVASTLEEAKLLMSINRAQDAIDHLKLIIESQPKISINHWLYLLEIYRTLNLKEDFERYAQGLHSTFNVMTPVWYEVSAAIVVPQHLEDFPHIMEKLDAVWPSDLAKDYLDSLITDNRDGDRAGFSKAVLDEILILIALLDTRKTLD